MAKKHGDTDVGRMQDIFEQHFWDLLLMEEIPHHLEICVNLVNNETNYQSQLVNAGFLNHQQYEASILIGIHGTIVHIWIN